jgi:hypothetical protein
MRYNVYGRSTARVVFRKLGLGLIPVNSLGGLWSTVLNILWRCIMDIKVFSFPTMENPTLVERTYCEILNAQRNGEQLADEVIDWMESANTWLIEAKSW